MLRKPLMHLGLIYVFLWQQSSGQQPPVSGPLAKPLRGTCEVALSLSPIKEPYTFESSPPKEAMAAANKRLPPTSSLFFLGPVNQNDYTKVFPESQGVTRSNLDELAKVRGHLLHEFDRRDADRDTTAATFEQKVQKASGSFVMVVGHNSNGRFIFLDGSSEGISELAEMAAKHEKRAVFLSCRSRQHIKRSPAVGLSLDVEAKRALDLAKDIDKFLKGREGRPVTLVEMHSFLNSAELKAERRHKVVFVAKRGCHIASGLVVVGIVVCLISDDCEIG